MSFEGEKESLIADVREHLLYMQELGVGAIDADLPEILRVAKPASAPAQATKAEPIERFVPKEVPRVQPAEEPRGGARSRLSSLPTLGKREPALRSVLHAEAEVKIPEKKIVAKQEVAKEPFADRTAGLPESDETIEQIRLDIGNCTRCPLHQGRTQIVHTTGNFQADLMFIGEAPGADEDEQGFPFVGRAGQLLTKIIEGIGFKREDVVIGNINRCRPPGNRAPTLPEAETCKPFLLREIAVVRPRVIVVLGNTATQNLLNTKVGISRLRGEFQDYFGVKVMPTFHPAYLLRDPNKKREVWEDMKKVRDYLAG